ncbi:MAG: hypothetical protein IJF41_05140 [Clostridia bacterium]|nr:hypothetical protein [Clostridia bacterium]
MPINIKYVNGLPVEGPELDEEATRRREELTELVMREYEEKGSFSSPKVCEAVAAFEAYAKGHIKED